MAEARDTQGILYQNLIDAGCGEALVRQFLQLNAAGKKQESLALLARHRQQLLDCCHGAQKKIDCLDYLIYQMRREEPKGGI